ncbi:hypothetical protein KUTeg_022887 [Tegillarca granosa]|uniref:CYTH domain-containing protein n=1 Tax=Tegillarca granosa TaxID=220873 RepID=A0ABQ9E5K7_TEGGR|nr:hypothetical protein KUTeg_022887 [Tegillarca granosa]
MPSNVEIKARVADVDSLKSKAAELSQSQGSVLIQEDVFFNVPNGRLKLRKIEETLKRALGIKGIVKKKRILYLVGQTRVHVDQVDKLGDFMELEVEIYNGYSTINHMPF